MSLRCSSARHAGNRYLPDTDFGVDHSKATGRTPDCLRCRRLIAADVRRRQKAAGKPEPSRTKRLCAEPGCLETPERNSTRYCAEHRKHNADGRKVRLRVRSDLEPTTRHDMAIKMLAGKW